MSLTDAVIGQSVTFSKTLGESDVYLFAGLTGDLAPQHVNDEYMSRTAYGQRIAHGVLLLGFASTASTLMLAELGAAAVSYGYDRLRFTAPAFIGDTVTVRYQIAEVDTDAATTRSSVEVRTQDDRLCLVATHILKEIAVEPASLAGAS